MPAVTDIRRLHVFLVGYEVLPKSVSTRGRGENFLLASPVCAYLVETVAGLVLIDCGIDGARLASPDLRERWFPSAWWPTAPAVLPQHELLGQLARIGLAPADVGTVILSHTHCDHTGNLKHFRHAAVHIQRREYDYAMGDHGNYAVFDEDLRLPGLDWRIHEGDWTLVSGLEAILTVGHMPGHQSFVVTLPESGVKILTIDAGDLQENFDEEIIPGECLGGDAEALASIRRLKRLRQERGAELMLLHDAAQVHRMRLSPDSYG
jgi:N-acyl homoserine lactone hydrolase